MNRDTDEGDEGTPWQEQANWETEQMKKSSLKTGAKDSQAKAKDYEYVFEDQIDFIMDRALAGDLVSFHSKLKLQTPPPPPPPPPRGGLQHGTGARDLQAKVKGFEHDPWDQIDKISG